MRVVAILATFNELRFIDVCLQHLIAQGLDVYLIDNESTDGTLARAEKYLDRGLIGIESFPRSRGVYQWGAILNRKEHLAATLDADWFMHVDADEIRISPRSDRTLREMFEEVDRSGFNAVNFMEFTFIPSREDADHDHSRFIETMRYYYPFAPRFPDRLNAWKRQDIAVELAWSGGHLVRFPGLRVYPESFKMRHYLFLSIDHFIEKYASRAFNEAEVQRGWHGWRARVDTSRIALPSRDELRAYVSDDLLDFSNAREEHYASSWTISQTTSRGDQK